MQYSCQPSKIQIYINTSRKTISKIKAELGCDVIINGGFYNMQTWKPSCHLRVDGKQLASDPYEYQGYGWDRADISMMSSKNESHVANFICCVALVQNYQEISPLIYDQASVGGKRGRTAIGTMKNGEVIVVCTKDGSSESMTPEELREKMHNIGCKDAIMLDGGLSSQCITPSGKITTTRNVQNYIAIWGPQSSSSISNQTPTSVIKCPYPEPVINIRLGSFGTGVKWVQWYLNYVYGSKLSVDGIFGAISRKTLIAFQSHYGLVPDGICGAATRKALKEAAFHK